MRRVVSLFLPHWSTDRLRRMPLAVADTPGTAHAVARHVPSGRPVTVESGQHRRALALLPIAVLRLDPSVVDALRRLGFERIEQLIDAPRGPLAKRFGRELHRRLDQALGNIPEPIEPMFPEEVPQARRGLLEPISTADAIGQVIRDLVDDLVGQLVTQAKGARKLDLYLHRVDRQLQTIRVGTAVPTRDPAHLTARTWRPWSTRWPIGLAEGSYTGPARSRARCRSARSGSCPRLDAPARTGGRMISRVPAG